MSRPFGWDLPPGCTHADLERAFGGDDLCQVCGEFVETCKCPECNICGDIGNPTCYERHGLSISGENGSELSRESSTEPVNNEPIVKAPKEEAHE